MAETNFVWGSKTERKEFEEVQEIPTINPVTKRVETVKQTIKYFKRFFKGINIDHWRKCSNCGGYNAPTKSKTFRYYDKYCRNCDSGLF